MSLQTSFLNSSFNQANSVDKAETDGQAAESIKKDLNQLFDVTKNLLEQMKNRAETVNQSLTATTTPTSTEKVVEPSQNTLEKLKEKIIENADQ